MKFSTIFLCFCILLNSALISEEQESVETLTQRAYSEYMQALEEKDLQKRQVLFNQALSDYVKAAEKNPTGLIFANIGTINMYLGEPGRSIFYLIKAVSLSPRNTEIRSTLQAVRSVIDLDGKTFSPSWSEVLSGSTLLSPSEKNGIMIAFTIIVFIIFSLSLWIEIRGLHITAIFLLLLYLLIFLLFYAVPFCFSPQKAIIMNSGFLQAFDMRRTNHAVSEDALVIPGQEIYILSSDTNGKWLRVQTSNGTIGYISGEDVYIY